MTTINRTPDSAAPFRVFISYAYADASRALPLVKHLRTLDIELHHSDELVAGKNIGVFMEEGLKRADVVFLLCSPTYCERFERRERGVGYEAEILTSMRLADELAERVVPVVLEGPESSGVKNVIPDPFRMARSIDARGPWSDAIARELERTLEEIAQRRLSLQASFQARDWRLSGPPGWLTVPPAPEVWLGRDADLTALKERLGVRSGAGAVHCVTALKGWPGIGKSALAVTLARDSDVLEEYREAVLWCSLTADADASTILSDWAQTLGLEELLHFPPRKLAEALRRRLEGKRALLVIDDVADLRAVELLLHARPNRGAVLVTTRQPDAAVRLAGSSVQTLQGLPEAAALELLEYLAPEPVAADREQASLLARDLEYLPLALHVAGRALQLDAALGVGPAELREQLNAPNAWLDEPVPSASGSVVPQTIQMLLERSTRTLDAVTQGRFAELSLLVPAPQTFTSDQCRTLWGVDPRETLRTFYHRGLLEALSNQHFRMHGLLHRYASSLYARGLV